MSKFRTAFEVLGLPETADDDQVQATEASLVAASGELSRNGLQPEQKIALDLLLERGVRQMYLELLARVRSHEPVEIKLADQERFVGLCSRAGIACERSPIHPTIFYAWFPDEPPPAEVRRWRLRPAPHPQLRLLDALGHVVKQVVFLGILRGKTPRQMIAIGVVYLVVIGAAVVAFRAAINTAAAVRVERARAERELLRGDLKRLLADAGEQAARAQDLLRQTQSDFERAFGIPLAGSRPAASQPAALELTLMRHASAKNAWEELLRVPAHDKPIGALVTRHRELEQRLAHDRFLEADRSDATRLLNECVAEVKALEFQARNIEHVRTMLEADRFEKSLQDSKGNSP